MIAIVSVMIVIVNAIIIMSVLLSVTPWKLTMRRKIIFFGGIFAIIIMQLLAFNAMGFEIYAKYYMLLAQLPVLLLFWIVSERNLIKVVFVMFTTIFMSFPTQLIGQINNRWLELSPVLVLVLVIASNAGVVFLIWKYMKPSFEYILDSFGTGEVLKFCSIPFLYDLIILASGGYVFAGQLLGLRILILLSTSVSYFLMMNILAHVREVANLQVEKNIMESQLASAQEKVESLHDFTEQAAIYRHDLRHHIGLISNFIENGQIDMTKEYLSQVQNDIGKITPIKFCENTAVNLIISAFEGKAKDSGVSLIAKVDVAGGLCVSETSICTVLSNGLENAINAAKKVEDASLRKIYLECFVEGNMLLIQIDNAFAGQCTMVNGVPISTEADHGYGCRSILAIAEKQKGHCIFKADDGIFTLKIVLPIKRN